MKPAAFAYHRPASEPEALDLLARLGGDAKPLAGGQSLVPAMNFRLARPAALVDLNAVRALSYIKEEGDTLVIGAMTRQRDVERSALVASRAPLLSQAMPWIAHPQIRNRGTIGGSLAHADPAAELPAVMVALQARMVLRSPGGTRRVPAAEFHTGLFTTALAPGELLVAVEIPRRPARSGSAFLEVSRRHGDFALAGVAAEVTLGADGRCAGASIALLSVGEGPVSAARAAAALRGAEPNERVMAEAARLASESDIDPPGDIHASPAYRRQLVRVLVTRALVAAAARVPS
jgi:aerobic carbon-monoxide dehydrogenase medium subunit